MRLIQHKREAYWFYRFLSLGYDRWVNPLFWTPAMRALALDEARSGARPEGARRGRRDRLHHRGHRGARGCGRRDDARPEPAPARRARAPSRRWRTARGCWATPRRCPFADDAFDRYVSAGSIEYWPDPQRGIAEAYRVTRAGGTALVIGPVRPANRVARALAEAWMLFPPVEDYTGWMEAAGFTDVRVVELAPDWYRDARVPVRAGGQRRQAARRGRRRPRARAGGRGAAVEPAAVRRAVRGRLGGGRRVRPDRRRARAARARERAAATA